MSSLTTRPTPTPSTSSPTSAPSSTPLKSAAAPPTAIGRARSSRLQGQRAVSSSRPVLDAATRAHVTAVRLASLEQDNYVEEVGGVDDAWEGEGEEEEQVMAGVAAAKGKGKGKGGGKGGAKRRREAEAAASGGKGESGGVRKVRLTLEEIIDRLGMREGEGAEVPNYVTAAAGPCPHPPRTFCSVCGYRSQYTCVRCGQRYCSIACQRTHQETRCGKGG